MWGAGGRKQIPERMMATKAFFPPAPQRLASSPQRQTPMRSPGITGLRHPFLPQMLLGRRHVARAVNPRIRHVPHPGWGLIRNPSVLLSVIRKKTWKDAKRI